VFALRPCLQGYVGGIVARNRAISSLGPRIILLPDTSVLTVNHAIASPLHRHQSSLEGVIDFSLNQSLDPEKRKQAIRIFNLLINHYESLQLKNGPYKSITLFRAIYEYAPS
jgi:hypothetical protein